MAEGIYSLCALTSLACTLLLFRGYLRTRHRVLLWSGACFAFLSINNVLLVVDKIIFYERDMPLLYQARLWAALIALLLLLYGLIYERD